MKHLEALAIVGLLCVVAVVAVVAAVQVDPQELYDQLCRNKEVEFFTKISQAKSLIEFVKSEQSHSVGCDPQIKEAILDLEEALIDDDPDNYCTPDRVNRITAYLGKHIKAPMPTFEVPEPLNPKHLPLSLKHFFIGYSLDVSKICKLGMLMLLEKDTREQVEPDHLEEVFRWTQGKDNWSKTFISRASNYDDMFLVGNAICDSGSQKCDKLYIRTVYWKKLQGMRETCHQIFRPFYSQLILPMVRLANYGIDYQGSDIRDKLDDFRENTFLQKWYKVVYICESLMNVVPLPKDTTEPEIILLDEEALKKIDEEELADELKEREEETKEGETAVLEIVETGEPCQEEERKIIDEHQDDNGADEGKTLAVVTKEEDQDDVVVVEECREGMKLIRKEMRSKKGGNFFSKMGKTLVKDVRKFQQDRKAYILSRKNMPATVIMLKKEVTAYEKQHKLNPDDFGPEPPLEYEPKPKIKLGDDLIPAGDKRIKKAIKQFEVKRSYWRKLLHRLTRRYVRLFRRYLLLGRVKFGGEMQQELNTKDLMLKVFDKAMWEKDNQELVNTAYGRLRRFMDFQNVSNLATWVSLILGLIGSLGLLSIGG